MHSLQHVSSRVIAPRILSRGFSQSKHAQLDQSWNKFLEHVSPSRVTNKTEDSPSANADGQSSTGEPSTPASKAPLSSRMMRRRKQTAQDPAVVEESTSVANGVSVPVNTITPREMRHADKVLASSAAAAAKRRADAAALTSTLGVEPEEDNSVRQPADERSERKELATEPEQPEATSSTTHSPSLLTIPPAPKLDNPQYPRKRRVTERLGLQPHLSESPKSNLQLTHTDEKEFFKALHHPNSTSGDLNGTAPSWPVKHGSSKLDNTLYQKAKRVAITHNNTLKKPQPRRMVRSAVRKALTEDTTPQRLSRLFGEKGVKELFGASRRNSMGADMSKQREGVEKGDRAKMVEGKLKKLFKEQKTATGDPLSGFTNSWGTDELAPKNADISSRDVAEGDKTRAPHFFRSKAEFMSRVTRYLAPPSGQNFLTDLKSPSEHKPIAQLSHGLDRVLFNPGIHWMQDPRSRVYNFTPNVQDIPKVTDFAFERLTGFIRSSSDNDLWTLAKQQNRRYAGSTSSLTSLLSHIYFLISGDREVDTSNLTSHFMMEPRTFTPGQRMPASITLRYRDGVYSLDSGHGPKTEEKTILTWMGTMLENYLTNDAADFSRLLRANPQAPEDVGPPMREAYRYSQSSKFVMRSQLDCVDPRLPGTGVFDIKTRAALPIRVDQLNYEENSGYQIRHLTGARQSFEKEYYDLIRSAFLKYSLQVRIGNMDGVFVAYHNTARLFGFQYIPLEEMERCLYGAEGRGQLVFAHAVNTLELVLDEVVKVYPEQSLRILVETRDGEGRMRVWVQPDHWTGEEQTRPIAELEVRAEGMIGGQVVPNNQLAINSCDHSPWSINLSILRSSRDYEELRANQAGSLQRQFRALALPTGVSLDDAEEYWNSIDHGQTRVRAAEDGEEDAKASQAPFDPAKFMRPTQDTLMLRSLARAGRAVLEAEEQLSKGRKKLVLGEPLTNDAEVEATAAEDNNLTAESRQPLEDEIRVEEDDAHIIDASVYQDPTLGPGAAEPALDMRSADTILQDSLKIMNSHLQEVHQEAQNEANPSDTFSDGDISTADTDETPSTRHVLPASGTRI